MRITRIEMTGFKSFARTEVFDFHDGVTAIVGPNGCGKSNVIDATRWVLGEQSRKDLRMKASTDVVFGGTAARRPARYAEVIITFDNSSGIIPTLGSEFTLARKLSATGESTYLINRNPAKLKDVRELFHGTGIGPDGFTIMEQGKIDALLQANPAERRKVFEEASGIAGYRIQKQSAERKLEVVATNLERLNDRIGEARTRLKNIKGQATRALKYKEYTERLRLMRTRLALKEFHCFSRQREDLLVLANDLGREEGRYKKDLTALHLETESVNGRLTAAEQELEGLRSLLHQLEVESGRANGQRQEHLARIEGLKHSAGRLGSDIERLREQCENLSQRRSELKSALKQARDERAEAEASLQTLIEAQRSVNDEAEALEKELSASRDSHLAGLQERSNLLNEKLTIDAQRKANAQRRFRLQGRLRELGSERSVLATTHDRANRISKEREAKVEELKTTLAGAESVVRTFNASLGELRTRRHSLELRSSGIASRVAHLEEIERMLEGVEQGSRELAADPALRARFGVQGLVAGLLKADIKVAPALERALGDLATAIVVQTQDNAFDAVDYLARKDGASATLVVRDFYAQTSSAQKFPQGQGVLGPLVDEISYSSEFAPLAQGLLGEWLLVADRDVARRLIEREGPQLRLVTPTGEAFGNGSCTLPSSDRTGGIITQRSELVRLRSEAVAAAADLNEVAASISQMVEEAQAANARVEELRSALYEATLGVMETRTDLLHATRRLAGIDEEISIAEAEVSEIDAAETEDASRTEAIAGEIEAVSQNISARETHISELAQRRASVEAKRQAAADQVTNRRIAFAEVESRTRALEASDGEVRITLEGFLKRIESDERELQRSSADIRKHEADIVRLEARSQEIEARSTEARSGLAAMQEEVTRVRRDVDQARTRERELNAKLLEAKEKVSEVRLNEEKLFLAMNNLREKLMEDYQTDLDSEYRSYDAATDHTVQSELVAEVEALQLSIRRLGSVNMESVDEMEEVEEQFNRFSRQQKDLVRAKQALEDAIRKIEGEARRRFIKTFETARGHFQRLFRKMFGGGSADMILLNPEDVLESGIEVMAKPPGMEPKSLNLLSGGQRTMIAVAMMFALFETCNAPYALLDEVDAALDEANVERFCTVLKEYAGQAQFIIITHHKKTMVNADRLYGVTMQEPGVSKRVSVDLERFDEALENDTVLAA